jgi:tetratricopeptide (TPR) repeat protein
VDVIQVDARGFHGILYKGAAGLVRALFERDPAVAAEAARDRLITLAPIAPEVRRWIAVPDAVEQALQVSREGNQSGWSQRVAHGVADFVLDCLGGELGPTRITVVNFSGAEPLDVEFFQTLRRRADPDRLELELIAASDASPPPDEEDAEALAAQARRCMNLACYEAALVWAALTEAALEGRSPHPLRARIVHERLFALLLLNRLDDVEALCAACLRDETDPIIQVDAGYARAILYARFYEASRRDYRAARACIEAALAAAARMPPGDLRVVNTAFLHNTLALVEMREGKPDLACDLLTGAIAQIAREAPDSFAREATILFQNRARLHRRQGRPEAALRDLEQLHGLEPSHEEAWFARALIHQAAGRHAEALADYDRVIFWGPPQVEAAHNRAQCLRALGRLPEAGAACDRALELDPGHLATRIDRACLSQALGDFEAMARDVEHGLREAPGEPRLLCLRGIAEAAEGRHDAALGSFATALERQPDLADAWANRALIHFRRGHDEQALDDIDRALALRDDPAIRRNRERILKRLRSARRTSVPGG